ncbi:MAG: LptF/LptG family permease [Phycisphaerales bacterium]|nr:LptF/LptG family permease [Phycisphaerales bacterium]
MTILDRSIARQYFSNTVLLLVMLCAFIVAVDATLNMTRFVRAAEAMLGPEQSASGTRKTSVTLLLILDLWWPRLLHLFNYLIGIVMVGAMGFTCAQMARHGEMTALLASGQSLLRVARPIIVVSACIVGLQALNQELLVPRIAPLLTRDHGDVGLRDLAPKRVLLVPDTQGRWFSAGLFDGERGTLDSLVVIDAGDSLQGTRVITASRARWRDGGWELEDGLVERASGAGGQPLREPIARIETTCDPTMLTTTRYAGYAENLSFAQLGEMLRGMRRARGPDGASFEDRARRMELLRWGRFARLGANLFGVILTIRFFLMRAPISPIRQTLKAAPLALAAIIGGIVAASQPLPGLPAAVSAFVPLVVLLPLVFYALVSIKS